MRNEIKDILDADAVVYAMPVYWDSIPAQIKGVIDRVFSLVVGGKDVAGKKMGLICCCEEHDPTAEHLPPLNLSISSSPSAICLWCHRSIGTPCMGSFRMMSVRMPRDYRQCALSAKIWHGCCIA